MKAYGGEVQKDHYHKYSIKQNMHHIICQAINLVQGEGCVQDLAYREVMRGGGEAAPIGVRWLFPY